MKKKNLIGFLSLVLLGALLAGCKDEIAPDKHTQDLMDQQRAAMSGRRGGAPAGGPPAGGAPGAAPGGPATGAGAPASSGAAGR